MSDNGTQAASGQSRNDPRGGTIIADRYQVDRLIARGGMAAVYLAHHIKLNRPIALKILSPPPDAEDPGSFEERFRLEAETLASLDHPNIVILHDFGETEDGRFFLAMEYIEGPRLSDVLRDGPLPVERALGLIMQVCAALRYAHKRGLVHRDLKPSNLLIRTNDNNQEQVKVVDFGLVKLTETDQSITRAGLILGSPHCMAPEQVKGLDVDHRTDIYACGILLYRTLTGQYPFHGPNSAATMIAHLNQPVPTFFSVAPDLVVPAGLEEVVRKCLAKNPNDRYATMADLMNDLAGCMNIPPEQFRSVSQSHSTIQKQLAIPNNGGRRGLLVGALVAALLLVTVGIGGTALFIMQPWASPDQPAPGIADIKPEAPKEPVEDKAAADAAAEDKAAEDKAADDEAADGEADAEAKAEEAEAAPAPKPKTVRPRTTRPRTTKPKATTTTTSKPPPEEKKDEGSEEEKPAGYMGLPDF